jgi:hypothetical protein
MAMKERHHGRPLSRHSPIALHDDDLAFEKRIAQIYPGRQTIVNGCLNHAEHLPHPGSHRVKDSGRVAFEHYVDSLLHLRQRRKTHLE